MSESSGSLEPQRGCLSDGAVKVGRCPVCGDTIDFDPAEFMPGHNNCWGDIPKEDWWWAEPHGQYEPVDKPSDDEEKRPMNDEGNTPPTRAALIEMCAESVHDKWMETKRAQGITSRPAEDGTEQMVPYAELPEHIKDLDRGSVEAVVDALIERRLLAVEAA